MYESHIKESGHNWVKQNLVTKTSRGKHYDEMTCSLCGMKGERYGLTVVRVSEKYIYEHVVTCSKASPFEWPEKIEIVEVRAVGYKFENLTPGTIHDVVAPPEGYNNDRRGVWVMGQGARVKVLTEEYIPAK